MMNDYEKIEPQIEQNIIRIEEEIENDEKLKPVPFSELMAKEFKDTEWLIEQLIPAEGIIAISGAPASYKTWLTLDLAIRVARGDILFDKFATSQSGVLVIDEENGERLLQKRLQKLQKNSDLPIYFLSLTGFKLSEDNIERFIAFSKEQNIKAIILDSLVRIHTEDENDAMKMAKVFFLLKQFNIAGLTVIFTHHNRKQGFLRSNPSQEMRGSSDILASVDCHLAIERKPKDEYITVTQTKLRQGEEIKPFKLNIINDESELRFEYAGEVDEVQTKKVDCQQAIKDILEQEGKPMFKKELADALKNAGVEAGYSTFKIAVKELSDKGELFEQRGEKNKTYISLKPFGADKLPIMASEELIGQNSSLI